MTNLTFKQIPEIAEMSAFSAIEFLLNNMDSFANSGEIAVLKSKGFETLSDSEEFFDVYLTVDRKANRIVLESQSQYLIVREVNGKFLLSHEKENKIFRKTSDSLFLLFKELRETHESVVEQIQSDLSKVGELVKKKFLFNN